LALETSCDETAVALLDFKSELDFEICNEQVLSQAFEHSKYGGIVPEIASRMHVEYISTLVSKCLDNVNYQSIDAIAVTQTPGLVGALLVGLNYAKSFAYAVDKPLITVNHIEGHICSLYINNKNVKFPFICLVVSGGHTLIIEVQSFSLYKIIATTVDDAAGEVFDKVARLLGLPYPGGPAIQECAKYGNTLAFNFPRVKIKNSMNFSFSGVKTAVINTVHRLVQQKHEINKNDVAASFQQAVCDVLTNRLVEIAHKKGITRIGICGGVACNNELQSELSEKCNKNNLELYMPVNKYTGDNAVMIGIRGYYDYLYNRYANLDVNARPNILQNSSQV